MLAHAGLQFATVNLARLHAHTCFLSPPWSPSLLPLGKTCIRPKPREELLLGQAQTLVSQVSLVTDSTVSMPRVDGETNSLYFPWAEPAPAFIKETGAQRGEDTQSNT